MRLCIDYRQLNAHTKSDAFPTGNILDVIENMAGTRYSSTIDLAQPYFIRSLGIFSDAVRVERSVSDLL